VEIRRPYYAGSHRLRQIKTITAITLPLVLYWYETWPFTEGRTQAEGVREEGAEEGIQA
jgi:hypothetical protein